MTLKLFPISLALLAAACMPTKTANSTQNLPYDGTTSETRAGKGGWYNGCPDRKTVNIMVCQGPSGQSISNFDIPADGTHRMDVLRYSTYRYNCDGRADQNCPVSGVWVQLLKP